MTTTTAENPVAPESFGQGVGQTDPVEAALARALDATVAAGCLERKTSGLMRAHLKTAGVTHARLFTDDATQMPIGFRSWRDTGITWLALAAVDVVKMQRRAGHDGIQTTMGYVKNAEDLSGTIGAPFPELPRNLVWPNDWPSGNREAGKIGSRGFRRGDSKTSKRRSSTGYRALSRPERLARATTTAEDPAATESFGEGVGRTEVAPSILNGTTRRADELEAFGPADPVEAALARALDAAAAAGRFDVVAQLARELEARRLSREPNVVALHQRKAK
jgi:hypothetical protein